MTMARMEVITSVQRRRRWSLAEKERIVAASLEPGAVASAVARAAGIHTSQLFRWRRDLCGPSRPTFAAVAIAPAPAEGLCGTIDIEFPAGARVRITGLVDPATVSAAIAALAMHGRRR
jgi:transposase